MQYVQLQRYQRLKIREKSQNQRQDAAQDHHNTDVALQLTPPYGERLYAMTNVNRHSKNYF